MVRACPRRYRVELGTEGAIRLELRSDAMRCAVQFAKRAARTARQLELARSHPLFRLGRVARPVLGGEAARAWWVYAAEFSCPRFAQRRTRIAVARAVAAVGSKHRYAQLLASRDVSVSDAAKTSFDDDQTEEDELSAIEREFEPETLTAWRSSALLERRRSREARNKTRQPKSPPDAAASAGWFSGYFGKAPACEHAPDEVSMAELEAIASLAAAAEDAAKPPPGFELLRCAFRRQYLDLHFSLVFVRVGDHWCLGREVRWRVFYTDT